MVTFLVCFLLLLIGFFTYSKIVERVFCVDDRATPAMVHPDGVDFVPMKTWRIFWFSCSTLQASARFTAPFPAHAGVRAFISGLSLEQFWAAAYMTFFPV